MKKKQNIDFMKKLVFIVTSFHMTFMTSIEISDEITGRKFQIK